jgi:hypothetical protein
VRSPRKLWHCIVKENGMLDVSVNGSMFTRLECRTSSIDHGLMLTIVVNLFNG